MAFAILSNIVAWAAFPTDLGSQKCFAEGIGSVGLLVRDAGFVDDTVAWVAAGTWAVILIESEASWVNHDTDFILVENRSFGTLPADGTIEGLAEGIDIFS